MELVKIVRILSYNSAEIGGRRLMKLVMNLKSNCSFWQPDAECIADLTSRLSPMDIVQMNSDNDYEELKDADFYCGWNFDANWISIAKRLKMIVVPSAGRDYLPLEALENAKIPVVTGTGYHAIPMSEQIMAYILGFSRGIFQTIDCRKTKKWWKDEVRNCFFETNGATIAIFGCGAVGKRVAKICHEMGMKVIGLRRNILQDEKFIEWHTMEYASEALRRADIVVNLLPLTPETEYYFNADKFSDMGHCNLFINIGRGKTVDETALKEALDSKIISYCALDVYDEKPPRSDSFLRQYDNIVLTPKTGVFFHQYMKYAMRFLAVVITKYNDIISGINTKYALKEYVYMAVTRYFNNDRLANLIDYNENDLIKKESFLDKCAISKDEILDKYKKSGRNWPFLAFTINSFCNRQCIFCDAKNEVSDILTIDQYREIARVSNEWNISKAHLSGGEPTIRKDVVQILHVLNEELRSANKQLGITTNGSCSYELIDQMISAGLTNINFSLHSLNESNYKKIMGNGSPDDTVEKVKYCISRGLKVKVNCTLLRSYTSDAIDMLELARNYPIDLRFVELQEIGPAVDFFDTEFISEDEFCMLPEVLSVLKNRVGEKDRQVIGVRSPGKYIRIKDWEGTFAFISNTSRPVCADGNRLKITPTGRLRPCTLENCDINLKEHFGKDLDNVYQRVFYTMLNRDSNPCHRGFHYIDYNLRWDNYKFDAGC